MIKKSLISSFYVIIVVRFAAIYKNIRVALAIRYYSYQIFIVNLLHRNKT